MAKQGHNISRRTSRSVRWGMVALSLLLGLASAAAAPRAKLVVSETPNVGVPFTLSLVVDGFAENPAPVHPELRLPGAKVEPAGAAPQVSRAVSIINGQRSVETVVRWELTWQVTLGAAGDVRIPDLTVKQGGLTATAAGGALRVEEVPLSDDMQLSLQLPTRPIWVGETIAAELVWLIRREPAQPILTVPMFGLEALAIAVPTPADRRQALNVLGGPSPMPMGFTQDEVDHQGGRYTRVRLPFTLAPRRAGALAIPPAMVMAELGYGRRDFFGQQTTRRFRAVDVPRTLEVRELPAADRPPSFAGAVGSSFGLTVTPSRSVVRVGEPVELTVVVKSDTRIDTIALARLDGPGGLPPAMFGVPGVVPSGEASADGLSKTFRVTVQLLAKTNKLPALEFAYFDPVKAAYQTVHSPEVALVVEDGTVVSAGDVVSGAPASAAPASAVAATPSGAGFSTEGVDFALGRQGAGCAGPPPGLTWPLVILLHVLPLGLLVWRTRALRTVDTRRVAQGQRQLAREVEHMLERAAALPAREAAGPLLRDIRKLLGGADDEARAASLRADVNRALEAVETEAYAPAAATQPLAPATVTRLRELLALLRAVVILFICLGAPGYVAADIPPSPQERAAEAAATAQRGATEARAAYQTALATTESGARQALFRQAFVGLAATAASVDTADAYVDAGNAALGAGLLGPATHAYRKALERSPNHARATHNLAWLRTRHVEPVRPVVSSASATLFFFHGWHPRLKLLWGSVAFAFAVALLVPWRRSGRRLLLPAMLAGICWLAMVSSWGLGLLADDGAIVMETTTLRAADSQGAPAALPVPVSPGVEVDVVEARGAWWRVRVGNGQLGWVPSSAVRLVASPLTGG